MKKIYVAAALFIGFGLTTSCFNQTQPNEDVVQTPSRDGSVETAIEIKPSESADQPFDLLLTTHKVWNKGELVRTFVTTDTLPTLGTIEQEVEDANGVVSKKTVPKAYELYITVK